MEIVLKFEYVIIVNYEINKHVRILRYCKQMLPKNVVIAKYVLNKISCFLFKSSGFGLH